MSLNVLNFIWGILENNQFQKTVTSFLVSCGLRACAAIMESVIYRANKPNVYQFINVTEAPENETSITDVKTQSFMILQMCLLI